MFFIEKPHAKKGPLGVCFWRVIFTRQELTRQNTPNMPNSKNIAIYQCVGRNQLHAKITRQKKPPLLLACACPFLRRGKHAKPAGRASVQS